MGVPHLISIIGAGPGDPELLTVKAHKRLQDADVVLYDALIGDKMLELVKAGAVKKYVGKHHHDGQDPKKRQDDIHAQFLFWTNKNKRVVRLKTGDPMIYGRGAEEIRFCKKHNLNFEVVPGVTAGIAASSLFSIPLTERMKSNMVLFYSGKKNGDGFPGIEAMKNVLECGSPVIIYMGLNNLPQLANDLEKAGINSVTPIHILCNISQPAQKTFTTSLAEVGEFLRKRNPDCPSTVIIGENASVIT